MIVLALTAALDARPRSTRVGHRKVMTVSATAYCRHGATSTGNTPRRGIVAADPRLLPIGTTLRIVGPKPYRGTYIVADRGSGVKGREIDIFMPSCRDARLFGRKQLQVEVIRAGDD